MPLISYVMTATSTQLLISESRDDTNRCTPCRKKADTHDTYVTHTLLAGGPRTWQPFTLTQQSWTDLLLLRKSAPDSTSQPG
jgi:hypothetical protein